VSGALAASCETINIDSTCRKLFFCRYQALVLLLFNVQDSLAFEDIKRLTGIEDKDLKLTLQSLSLGKPVRKTAHWCFC
jgi:hypothetical protein